MGFEKNTYNDVIYGVGLRDQGAYLLHGPLNKGLALGLNEGFRLAPLIPQQP
jgi:hypothetical protein